MNKKQFIFLPAVIAGVAIVLTSGIASADNVFVSNNGNGTVEEITGSSMPTTIIDTGLNSPTGIAIYGNDVFVANNGSSVNAGYVEEYSLATDLPVATYATGLVGPRGIAFDSAGNLYVADQGNGSVVEIPTGGGSVETLATGLTAPNDVVFANGVLYATEGGSNQVVTIADGGAAPLVTGNGLSSPNGIAFDGGNLLVVNHGSAQVLAYSTGGTNLGSAVQSPYLSSLNQPKAIAVDSEGDFYVTDNGDETVTEYSPTGVLLQVYSTDAGGNPAFNGSGFIVTQSTVPEPTTYALMFAGLGVLIFMARRKAATA
jgi:serine/threonine-protein kinase